MIGCCVLELWLIEAQPIGRKGAGLHQLQLIPIGRLSPQTKFGQDSMLQTEVMVLEAQPLPCSPDASPPLHVTLSTLWNPRLGVSKYGHAYVIFTWHRQQVGCLKNVQYGHFFICPIWTFFLIKTCILT